MSINQIDREELIFAVVAQDTKLECLLLAAGSYEGYHNCLAAAKVDPDASDTAIVGPMPCILNVLEDMAGRNVSEEMKHLKCGEADGTLEFFGAKGDLLLPSIDASTLLAACSVNAFTRVQVCVEVNSDACNQGLGVVIEKSPLEDSTIDESGLPSYIYNGYGVKDDKKSKSQCAVKFHPGMNGGMLRVEGAGGFRNQNVGFRPLTWRNRTSGSIRLRSRLAQMVLMRYASRGPKADKYGGRIFAGSSQQVDTYLRYTHGSTWAVKINRYMLDIYPCVSRVAP